MLPFLKDRKDGSMSSPVQTKERETDGEDDYGMLDAVAEDMLEAMHKGDKKLMKAAIEALIDHIQSLDEVQDTEEMK